MGTGAPRAALIACLFCAFLWLTAAAPALADTDDIIAPSDVTHPSVDSGWQAGTCKAEPAGEPCSIATPELFFETAGAHPNFGFTQFIIKHGPPPGEAPVDELKTVRVDLPVGLSVNPGATVRCKLTVFEAGASGCPVGSKVGESFVTAAGPLGPIDPAPGVTQVPVYNVEPKPGEAARFGLELAENEVFLEGDVAWSTDFHEGFTIHVPAALPSDLGGALGLLTGQKGLILKNRLVFNGRAGDGTFLTTPTTCFGPAYADDWEPGEQPGGPSGQIYSTFLRADSVGEPDPNFPNGSSFFESPIPPVSETSGPGTEPKDCDTIPYDPSIDVDPGTAQTDSPAGATVSVDVPHLLPDFIAGEDEQDSSHTRQATVSLPRGMGLNPSAANGLQVCSDAEFGKGTRNPVACPPQSVIGRAKIESPPLEDQTNPQPEEVLEGNVYVGKQLSRDPTSGDEYRIFIEAKSDRYGIAVRLIGNVRADPQTGQLTTTIANTPQVPFTSFELTFDGGPRAVLSSPPTCGPNETTSAMTPWSGNAPAHPKGSFSMTAAPGGGKCAKTLAERPFGPLFGAGPVSSKAGAFSPFTVHIDRSDGQQELNGADVILPPGMTGKLRGIPYCPESALAAAATRAGAEEKASSSCPAASQVGIASVAAGTGSAPYKIDGKVFLSGPYHGAPLSLAVVTPATAGPFDLGTVVVRVALFVDPETAQIRAVSDPIPHVFGGALLSIRSVDLKMDRPNFTLNPTSCEPFATSGALQGGGGDPANPAAFSAFAVSAPFQASGCEALAFKPKLFTKLIGGRKTMRRNGHPAFRAVLVARAGDANIKRAALTLPHSQFLDQGHIGTICTRVQLAASACPARSIYGYARAQTPLLDDEVQGPVYLISSEHELPDLLADLHGQVNVRLRGVISSAKERLKTVFFPVPDVPVSKFRINMKGGKKGLLVNSRDLCNRPNRSVLNFKAQNGKQVKVKKLPLRTPACRKAKKKRSR
ncbi:MAG: hypothetical protein QOF06_802 [Solirubrobacterales bacterium]|jgi:hypothetical protein|nr:hypothetical protein [Solirubrobacterales bacterium]